MNNVLCCQWCGNDYTHHYYVEVCDREEDDTTTTVASVMTRGGAFREARNADAMDFQCTVGSHPSANVPNPSPRRHGVNIEVICEECDKVSAIHVFQHKGQTIVRAGRVAMTE